MPQGREHMPMDIRRAVLVEAGHRCAVPACRQFPVVVEHIVDYAGNRKHEFSNLIVLCPTCHARKGDGAGQIDRKSLKIYKLNLGLLTSRYTSLELQLLRSFQADVDTTTALVGVELMAGVFTQL